MTQTNSIYRWGARGGGGGSVYSVTNQIDASVTYEQTHETIQNYESNITEVDVMMSRTVLRAEIPMATIPNADFAQTGIHVPADHILFFMAVGIRDEYGGEDPLLTAYVANANDPYDGLFATNGRYSTADRVTGTGVVGPFDLNLHAINRTGDELNVTAYAYYIIEKYDEDREIGDDSGDAELDDDEKSEIFG